MFQGSFNFIPDNILTVFFVTLIFNETYRCIIDGQVLLLGNTEEPVPCVSFKSWLPMNIFMRKEESDGIEGRTFCQAETLGAASYHFGKLFIISFINLYLL